jgi:hypothetical protein
MLDGWNLIQGTNVFVATLIWLFFNYSIKLEVNLAKNAQINTIINHYSWIININ